MIVLAGMLFEPIGFEGLRDIVIFLTSISSESLRKKKIILLGGENHEYLIEGWMPVATLAKYLLKALVISCGSAKLRLLSKILNAATFF